MFYTWSLKEFNVFRTCVVGVDNGEDALEVELSLPVFADAVANRNQAGLELLWC